MARAARAVAKIEPDNDSSCDSGQWSALSLRFVGLTGAFVMRLQPALHLSETSNADATWSVCLARRVGP